MIEVEHSNEMDELTLLIKDTNSLILGGPTKEGGDVKIYRDGSNNLALFFDADAASNAKALDVYGGVIFQNFLTVGQTTLNTIHALYVNGTILSTDEIYCNRSFKVHHTYGIRSYNENASQIPIDIIVTTPDTTDHAINLKIDTNNILAVQATGDGAGGIVDLKVIVKEQLVYTPSSDTAITAAGGITVTKAIMRVAGDSGAIDITANPQIAAGTDGQVVIIQGTHDTNTVTLDDGTGLALSAQCVLAAQDNITLMYDSGDSEWIETSRTTVT